MDYFYIENDSQKGPVSAEELIKFIKPDTKVWCAGMANWQSASDVQELASMMGLVQQETSVPTVDRTLQIQDPGAPAQVDANAQYSNNGSGFVQSQANDSNNQGNGFNNQNQGYYNQNQAAGNGQTVNQNSEMQKPDNYLVWAILCTVMCCLPLGIVSLLSANKVDLLWSQGKYAEAMEASQKAKKFAIWGAVGSAIFFVLYFAFYFALFAAGVLTNM